MEENEYEEEYLSEIEEQKRIAEMRKYGVPVIETKEQLIQALLRTEEEIESGRYKDAEEVHKEWRERYGIQNKVHG